MLEAIMNFLFPPCCPACEGYVEHHGHWCSVCLSKYLLPRYLPLDKEQKDVFSEGIVALGVYEHPLKGLIGQLKFNKKKRLAKGLNYFVQNALEGEYPELAGISGDNVLATAVPLHIDRLRERGFNQDELIFKRPMESYGVRWEDLLERQRYTIPQFHLDKEERRDNIKGAFRLKEELPKDYFLGKRVVLLDDIATSGITMLECGRVLQAAGAESIMGLVLSSGRK